MNDPDSPLLLTITAAAKRLGISRGTMHSLLDAGEIPYRRVGSDRRIPFAALKAYAERDLVQAER